MYEGKMGEYAVSLFFEDKGVPNIPDSTPVEVPDDYDFLVYEQKIDVKSWLYHKGGIAEMVHQAVKRPKDIYIGVYIDKKKEVMTITGWVYASDLYAKKPENLGHEDNYIMYPWEQNEMKTFKGAVYELEQSKKNV